jgi:serine/threonine protein kinase
MADRALSASEIEAGILADVVRRYVKLRASTSRDDLVVKFRDVAVLTDLVNRRVLRQTNSGAGDEYLPTAAAFELCEIVDIKETAKSVVTTVLHVLQNMAIGDRKAAGYEFDDLKRHAIDLFDNLQFDDKALKLGLYLAQDFNVFTGFRLNPPDNTEILWFGLGEAAIILKDIDEQWQKLADGYRRGFVLQNGDDPEQKENTWEELSPLGEGGQSRVVLVRRPARVEQRRRSLKVLVESKVIPSGDFADAVWTYARPEHPSELAARKIFKIPSQSGPEQRRAIERLKNEIAVLKENKPGLPQLLDADAEQFWIVTEFFEEGTLEKQPLRYKGQVLRALKAFRSLVQTVSDIHKDGYVHRDIKPANVFIRKDDELVLGDFGIVFVPGLVERLTFTDERVGPRDYMPQWGDLGERLENVQPNFDVYMLGKFLWCMVSGRHKLPREYHRRGAYDLVRLFPNDPAMGIVNEILDDCVVEEPQYCLKSAEELLVRVSDSLNLLERGLPMIDQSGKLSFPCRMCGKGFYREHSTVKLAGLNDMTNRSISPIPLRIFVCHVCSHYEFFAPGFPDESAKKV